MPCSWMPERPPLLGDHHGNTVARVERSLRSGRKDVDGRDIGDAVLRTAVGEPSGLAFGKPKGELSDAVLRTAMASTSRVGRGWNPMAMRATIPVDDRTTAPLPRLGPLVVELHCA